MLKKHNVRIALGSIDSNCERMLNVEGYLQSKKKLTDKRERNIGSNVNICMENNMRAKTDTSSCRREAKTTEADTAAFMEKMDVSLRKKRFSATRDV